jgi:hypothetical protein
MSDLGGVWRGDGSTHLMGVLSLIASMAVYGMALEALRREAERMTDAERKCPWWFGYTRDLTNILGLVLIAISHHLLGFPGPIALLAGFLTGLLLYSLDYALARVLKLARGFWVLVLVMTILTSPTQIAPRRIAVGLGRALQVLFS